MVVGGGDVDVEEGIVEEVAVVVVVVTAVADMVVDDDAVDELVFVGSAHQGWLRERGRASEPRVVVWQSSAVEAAAAEAVEQQRREAGLDAGESIGEALLVRAMADRGTGGKAVARGEARSSDSCR